MSTMMEKMFGLGADLPEESEINVEDEFIKKITEGDLPLEESSLSINDLKTFYNTSDTIDKDKYPNFFEWYDYMVRSGKYHNESVEEDGKEEKKDKILNEEDPSTEEEISEYNDLGIDTRTGLKVDEYECPVCGEVVNKNDLTCRFCDSKLNESLGYDINEYQEWVDYDMKHYGKISDETNQKLNDAGLEVVKDDHGDYEVIAKDRKELGEDAEGQVSEDDDPLECAKMSFEAGHRFEENDFGDPESYNKYLEYMEMGPAGFYEEFKDELDFDEDFIAEYGEIDESLKESTFSRIAGAAKDAFNKFKTDTMFEDDKYGRKLLNYVDKFKKEFNITEKTHYNSFSYTREQGKEYRTYHAYIDNVPREITHQFVSEKYSSDTKPEYLSRGIVWFLDPKRKANYELEDGEIQTEINPESIHFYLRVVVDAEWGQKDQDKRYAKYHKKLGIKDESLKESTDSLSRIKKKFYSDNTPAGHLWKAVDLTSDEMNLIGKSGEQVMNDGRRHPYVQLTDKEYSEIFEESLKESRLIKDYTIDLDEVKRRLDPTLTDLLKEFNTFMKKNSNKYPDSVPSEYYYKIYPAARRDEFRIVLYPVEKGAVADERLFNLVGAFIYDKGLEEFVVHPSVSGSIATILVEFSKILPLLISDNNYLSLFESSLTEDTVKKSNGKWTNRGDDGTEHGEFKTKKAADAQRKAMFANGYKAEGVHSRYFPERGDRVEITGATRTYNPLKDGDRSYIGKQGKITYVGSEFSAGDVVEVTFDDGTREDFSSWNIKYLGESKKVVKESPGALPKIDEITFEYSQSYRSKVAEIDRAGLFNELKEEIYSLTSPEDLPRITNVSRQRGYTLKVKMEWLFSVSDKKKYIEPLVDRMYSVVDEFYNKAKKSSSNDNSFYELTSTIYSTLSEVRGVSNIEQVEDGQVTHIEVEIDKDLNPKGIFNIVSDSLRDIIGDDEISTSPDRPEWIVNSRYKVTIDEIEDSDSSQYSYATVSISRTEVDESKKVTEALTEEKHPLKIEIPKILFYGYLGDMEYDDGSVMSPDEVKSAGFKVKDQRVYLPAGIYEAEWFKGKGAPAGFDFKMKDGQWYPFVSNSRNEEGTVYKIVGKKYEESFKLSLKEDVEETLPGPDDSEDLSLSNMISKGIKDEYDTIELYNSLSLLAKEQGRDDIAELVDNINTEENNHVGMLQQAFKTLSENGDAVESGDKEAEEYLDEPVKLELKDSNDFKLELR